MSRLSIAPDESPVAVTPAELGESGRRLWESLTTPFEFDVHELLLLLQACRTADLLDRLSKASAGAPLAVVNGRGDQVANPLVTEHRQQSLVLARLLASLRLPSGEEGPEERRPQRRGAARGSYGVRRAV